jgi:hypothetical protein
MRIAGERRAAAARQFGGGQHAVVVEVHRVETVAHPGLVFGERDAAVPVRVHACQVARRIAHLWCGERERGREQRGQHRQAAAPRSE